jgi:hypothetical protein
MARSMLRGALRGDLVVQRREPQGLGRGDDPSEDLAHRSDHS